MAVVCTVVIARGSFVVNDEHHRKIARAHFHVVLFFSFFGNKYSLKERKTSINVLIIN